MRFPPLPLLFVLLAACLPPKKSACRDSNDCSRGRACVAGTCHFPGLDGPVEDGAQPQSTSSTANTPEPPWPVDAAGAADAVGPDGATDTQADVPLPGPPDSRLPTAPDNRLDLDGAIAATSPSCSVNLICADGLSCCQRYLVPGGTFPMGRGATGADACPGGVNCDPGEQPEHPATVSTFELDAFETTVGRFRAFVQYLEAHPGWQPTTGAGRHHSIPNSGWNQGWSATLPKADVLKTHLKCYASQQTWTDLPGDNENKPINCISWYEAFAFCAWDEGRLPTEAEWEYAAAGGANNRLYPWGSGPVDCEHANIDNGLHCAGSAVRPLPVGSAPKGNGLWGHRDLAGNVLEWVLDLFSPYSDSPCIDCANLATGSYHTMRGGNFGTFFEYFRVASRMSDGPLLHNGMGVRCARNAP